MNAFIINGLGTLLIIAIIWWFFCGKQRRSATVSSQNERIDIHVDNGIYTPNTVHAQKGDIITLYFTRGDPSPCAEAVVFPELGISQDLPLNEPKAISIKVDKTGEYAFTCPMGMYRGTLIVK